MRGAVNDGSLSALVAWALVRRIRQDSVMAIGGAEEEAGGAGWPAGPWSMS